MNPVLEIADLHAGYATARGYVDAVAGVSLSVGAGETVGLVGESGCGKTTLARAVVGLVRARSGSIRIDGTEIVGQPPRVFAPLRRTVQYVFQDPMSSLNPRLSAATIIGEPLDVAHAGTRSERAARVAWLMERVGLRPEWGTRRPHEFSGGQRQRIGIARALALEPKLVLCDEPVSALDVSIQAQIVNLLADLQRDLGVAYLFISHDLAVVEVVADRIAVMYLGRIVETAERESLWAQPLHPYTRAMIDAIPIPDPGRRASLVALAGDVPSQRGRPAGCCFVERCPLAQEICRSTEPPLIDVAPGRRAACHFVQPVSTGSDPA